MKHIFWGLIFLFFDFNIGLGSSTISLLPAFVGYALIRSGMGKVARCETFAKSRPWVTAGIVYSAIVWVLNCLGLALTGVLSYVVPVIGGVLQLLTTYKIAKGIRELEDAYGYDMYGRSLMTAWIVLLVWVILVRVTAWLGVEALALLALMASFVFMIYYILRFHKSRKAYDERMEWTEDENEASHHF